MTVFNTAVEEVAQEMSVAFPGYSWAAGWPRRIQRNTVIVQGADSGTWLKPVGFKQVELHLRLLPLFPTKDIAKAEANLMAFLSAVLTDLPTHAGLTPSGYKLPTVSDVEPISFVEYGNVADFLSAPCTLTPLTVSIA